MNALAVNVNGKRCCTAGVIESCCITAELSLVAKIPEGDGLFLRVRGVDISGGELLEWFIPALNLTDRIEFEVIETNTVDPPSKRLVVDKN